MAQVAPPRACPRCRGYVVTDARPGAWEPYCFACGWCWWSPGRLRLSRLLYLVDRLHGGHGARVTDGTNVERMREARRRHQAAWYRRKRASGSVGPLSGR